ncbi:mechanosensitive ion channel domain-containing protein [Pseudohalocynthiibacter sp. F2068]|uniref:mechanosensitive ion channel family protein n=1 Tax=Pseudohalocynthiibacter sp. F2068 TaxID=2926418 RepID=UPI001FF4D1D8|nr:mechanosensitive ion channel [Pseudohalocynthiibacter sp. F2068]
MTEFQTLLTQIQVFLANLLLPSRLYQIAIAIALFAVAQMINMFIAPRLHAWMRNLEDRPKWQLRWLVVLHRRLYLIIFVLLIWTVIAFMREVLNTFPSRTFLLSIIGTIAVAWLAIAMIARLIRNRFMRRLATWGGWAYVTLYYLGFIEATSDLLDNVAIEFGDFRLSAFGILKALVVTGLLFFFARLISTQSKSQIEKNQDISPSMRVLMVKFLQIVLYGAAFFIGLKAVGFDLTGLAVLSGAIGVGLGFGLQKVVSNLVSGVIILLDKSIKPGDVISLGETFGWINSLGARYVSVVTRDGREYLIPNEDLITNQVVNWSHSNDFVRLDIFFGVAYGDDPHKVRALAIEAASAVGRILTTKPPVCHIVGFGDSSVDYILRFWITDPTAGLTNVRGAVYLALWDKFKENDISIPFPQREVRMLPDEMEKPPKPLD